MNQSRKQYEFIFKSNQPLLTKLNEDDSYIPRFTPKSIEIFEDIPVNEPLKYSDALVIKGIKNGMIFLVNYRGEKDKLMSGHERVAYFMVLGKSTKGKTLLRVYHLNGWSVSQNTNINKTWRMFRTDRILSLTFTGSFFRLPPEGYNANDKGMTGGIIASADFTIIRNNQEKLLRSLKIQDKNDVNIESENNQKTNILVTDTKSILNVLNPMDNAFVASIKDIDNLRLTFLKSLNNNERIAILGAMGKPNNIVHIKEKGTNKEIGTYKVLDSITGKMLKSIKNIKTDADFKLYIFDKKL